MRRRGQVGRRRTPGAGADLAQCDRVLVLGRTGSGKTTLARELSVRLGVPHIELDALYFDTDLSRAPLPVLRARTEDAVAAERWVTDGNKKAVRDLVWPRADTVVWLDYPLAVSLWRLARRAASRTAAVRRTDAPARGPGSQARAGTQLLRAAGGVLRALRSHRGQRRRFPELFAEPQHRHLAVVRLRSPRATRRWLQDVTGDRR